MKDEGGGEDGDEGAGEGSDEGWMKVILSYLRGFDDKQTETQTFVNVELLLQLKMRILV